MKRHELKLKNIESNNTVEPKHLTFNNFAYLCLDNKTFIKDSSLSKLRQTIRYAQPIIGDLLLNNINAFHIEQFVRHLETKENRRKKDSTNKLGLSAKTISTQITNLSNFFNMAVRWKFITDNPCTRVKKPRVNSNNADPFSIDEMLSILDYMTDHYPQKALFYAIGFLTGIRPGEILALKWTDIDFENKAIHISKQHTNGKFSDTTKTYHVGKRDIIPLLMNYLHAHKKIANSSEYLFVNQYNKPYMRCEDFKRYYWDACLDALKIRSRCIYQMRHTFAFTMLNNGLPENWIAMRMLGHKNTVLLRSTYSKFWDDKFVIEEEKFDFLSEKVSQKCHAEKSKRKNP